MSPPLVIHRKDFFRKSPDIFGYRCKVCGELNYTEKDLEEHLSHHPMHHFKCFICSFVSKRYLEWFWHMTNHHKISQDYLGCHREYFTVKTRYGTKKSLDISQVGTLPWMIFGEQTLLHVGFGLINDGFPILVRPSDKSESDSSFYSRYGGAAASSMYHEDYVKISVQLQNGGIPPPELQTKIEYNPLMEEKLLVNMYESKLSKNSDEYSYDNEKYRFENTSLNINCEDEFVSKLSSQNPPEQYGKISNMCKDDSLDLPYRPRQQNSINANSCSFYQPPELQHNSQSLKPNFPVQHAPNSSVNSYASYQPQTLQPALAPTNLNSYLLSNARMYSHDPSSTDNILNNPPWRRTMTNTQTPAHQFNSGRLSEDGKLHSKPSHSIENSLAQFIQQNFSHPY